MKLIVTTAEGVRVGEITEDAQYDLEVSPADRDEITEAIRYGLAPTYADTGDAMADSMVTPPERFVRHPPEEVLYRIRDALRDTTGYRGHLVAE